MRSGFPKCLQWSNRDGRERSPRRGSKASEYRNRVMLSNRGEDGDPGKQVMPAKSKAQSKPMTSVQPKAERERSSFASGRQRISQQTESSQSLIRSSGQTRSEIETIFWVRHVPLIGPSNAAKKPSHREILPNKELHQRLSSTQKHGPVATGTC